MFDSFNFENFESKNFVIIVFEILKKHTLEKLRKILEV